MKKISRVVNNMAIMMGFPVIAGAAGTYYNGDLYQNPQSRYANGGFYNNYGAGRGYGQNQSVAMRTTTTRMTKKSTSNAGVENKKQGLRFDAYLSHEFANWNLEMKQAGSKLHYDNLQWNVIGGEGIYYFGDKTPMQIKVGAKYGVQFGDSPMIDDDVSTEKMWEVQQINVEQGGSVVTENLLVGTPALSVGTSKDGSQVGFNAAFGLTDFFSMGRMKVTPSIGYRYFKYKLETKNNYGLMVNVLNSDTFVNCLEVSNGEIQCSPYIGFANDSGIVFSYGSFAFDDKGNIIVNNDGSYVVYNNPSATQIDVGNTYYYEQHGASHKYETEWSGPYLALDMEYVVNNDNFVNAGIEFGLPVYKSKGDQPYRIDWAHPTSVEDKGSFGDAWHFGLNASWSTAITDSVMLSLGLTYDYYKVSGATASTYLNQTYYQSMLDNVESWIDYLEDLGTLDDNAQIWYDSLKNDEKQLEAYKSAGWKLEDKSEIESFYKSMGIRVGINAKF